MAIHGECNQKAVRSRCGICNRYLRGSETWQDHERSREHLRSLSDVVVTCQGVVRMHAAFK